MINFRFGNANIDHWQFSLRGVHPREQVVELTGELSVGGFSAVTPMCLPPEVLESFASELQLLNKTLSGSATLRNSNPQSEISWSLVALPHGHIESVGRYTMNGNTLDFRFRTDQTQLRPLLRGIEKLLKIYNDNNQDGLDEVHCGTID